MRSSIFVNFLKCFLSFVLTVYSTQLLSKEQNYGSFVFNSEIPSVIFAQNEIIRGDDLEFRKVLRNHDQIKTIVLNSPGGDLWTSLNLAGIILDKKLQVYIPKEAECASACAFLFFGGQKRLGVGKLGVHQFSSSNGTVAEQASKVEMESQSVVSEIIGFLNEFQTPRFVMERMFESPEIYWFSQAELLQLATPDYIMEEELRLKISEYLSELRGAKQNQKSVPKVSEFSFPQEQKERVAAFQLKFNLLGCDVGAVDGKWGPSTETAFRHLSKILSEPYQKSLVNDSQFYNRITSLSELACLDFIPYTKYKAYNEDYFKAIKKCHNEVPRTTNLAIDVANCVWKYDEKALAKHSLMRVYELAYRRYTAAFNLAKSSTVSYYSNAITREQYLHNVTTKMANVIGERTRKIREELGIFVSLE